ncbi:MAG: SDR family NAD(P)-dependent oxidoreductase [Syntrophobacteraceae bacterium]
MDLGLKDKVVIITGGGQGAGRIMSQRFAQEGAKVVIADLNLEAAQSVVKEVEAKGGKALATKTDVSSLADVEKTVAAALDKFGGVDVIVHNAAMFSIKPFMDTPVDVWDKVLGVIQGGAFNCAKAALPKMIEQKSGRIIFIGSDAGRVGDPYQPIYASAKAGIIGFCKSLAQDAGPKGISVNVVSPALIMTDENKNLLETQYGLGDEKRGKKLLSAYPMRRVAVPDDIANLVMFLCSDKGAYITGQTISVDGGYCMM